MSTDDATGQAEREARLDADLRALLSAPVDTRHLLAGAERRIARWRLVRMLMPWAVAAVLSVLLGPVLWRLAGALVANVPGLSSLEFTADGLAAVARELPVYVWAFVAGVGVTVAATLAER